MSEVGNCLILLLRIKDPHPNPLPRAGEGEGGAHQFESHSLDRRTFTDDERRASAAVSLWER